MSTEEIWGELIVPSFPNLANPIQNPFPVKGKKFVIGRGRDCDLHLPRKQVSSLHCFLTIDGNDVVWLHDTSLNGTTINKEIKVTNGKSHEIRNGDLLYLVLKKKEPKADFFLTFQAKRTPRVTNSEQPSYGVATTSTAIPDYRNVDSPEPLSKRIKLQKDSKDSSLDGSTGSPAKPIAEDTISNETTFQIKDELMTFDESNQSRSPQNATGTEFRVKTERSSFDDSDGASTVVLPGAKLDARLKSDFHDDYDPPYMDSTSFVSNDDLNETVECGNASPSNRESSQMTNAEETGANARTPLAHQTSAVEDNVCEVLRCSLCLEILHDPICLQPCMHCYCSACYSQWMDVSDECPQCRSSVERLARNHLVGNLLEAYLKDHPEKKRSLSEIERLDSLNTITADMLNVNRHPQSSSNSEDESIPFYVPSSLPIPGVVSFQLPHVPRGQVANNCRQCPQKEAHKPKRKKKTKDSNEGTQPSNEVNNGASSSTTNSTAVYSCPPGQPHAICNCCYKSMPDRRNEDNVPPQQCSICKMMFCHLYWGCQKPGCSGCLNKFGEINYTENSLQDVVRNNKVETQILFDYLRTQQKNAKNLVQECMERLDAGTYKCTLDLTSSTVLCYTCALRNLSTLSYFYRRDISHTLLPDAVRGRNDCHWGHNCRTQGHNISHAERYNHICEQTRF